MTGPTVSVVIPAYNAAAFLGRTLASVVAQTRPADEIVVVDDHSTDATAAVARQFAADCGVPVRVIDMPRNTGGPGAPLNAGVAAARGDVIATLDHDDRMSPTRLADQLAVLAACPGAGLVLGPVSGRLADLGWRVLRSLPASQPAAGVFRVVAADAYCAALVHGCYAMTCSAMLFPKTAWIAAGGFEPRVRTNCDYAFLRAVTRGHDLAFGTTVVADWTDAGHTLYSAAGAARRLKDDWAVLAQFGRDARATGTRTMWAGRAKTFLCDAAYELRTGGRHYDAVRFAARAVRHSDLDRRAVVELAKALAAAARATAWPTRATEAVA